MTQTDEAHELNRRQAYPLPLNAYRPETPVRGLSVLLRRIAGVNEGALDWVPEERPRYSRLGAIILNTGLLAGSSLMMALRQFSDVSILLLIPVALFWGYVILCFDSWLIASTHGILTRSRMRIFIPRLAISVLLGFAIAEPIVLWVFSPSIDSEIASFRLAAVDGFEANLTRCNPPDGSVPPGSCDGLRLSVADGITALRSKLNGLIQQRDGLSKELDGLNAQLANLQDIARKECNGTSGPGLTGIYGDGVNCDQDRNDAFAFQRDNHLAERQSQISTLTAEITDIQSTLGTEGTSYADTIASGIRDRVAEFRRDQGPIGLLDEVASLERLAEKSVFVLTTSWVLRLLLVAIDSLPVLTKLFSGTTAYDELISRQASTGRRLHEKYLLLREKRDGSAADVYTHHTEFNRRARLEKIEEADRAARADKEADLEAEIDALAARLRGDVS